MKRRSFIKSSALATSALSTFGSSMVYGKPGAHHANNNTQKSEKVKIAVVQQDGNHGQVNVNRKKALKFAEDALNQNADVILFHEELLIGYDSRMKELAEPVNGPTTKAFQELLRGSDALVIYGLTEKDKDDYYISAPVVSADGVITTYRKTHLWWEEMGLRHEPTFYKPGNNLVTFEVKGHKSGLMICYDGDFPEMTRSYANLDCTMVFWMNNRGQRGHDEVTDLAYRNSMIIPSACCCGLDEVGNSCRGGSNITGPDGKLISEIWDKEGFIIGDVYPGKVRKMREENPWYTGLRPEIYVY